MKRGFTILLFSVGVLFSCNTTHNADLIAGDWKGAQWMVDGKPSANDATGTAFHFSADGNYTYDYAGSRESGLYKVDGDNLYTTPTGGQAIMVHIARLTKDSLVFDMNRSGRSETLILLRK
jgi:hypothetical protein